ncbi:mono/diheme cytochrome c family protein [Herbaspirillum rubrisubalbicans]|uniref:cytochrome c n=1 Tax=Herbaspirillum rubrisubalbicans TaxID=80842 RepID=UPI00209D2E93|nr:cytochrome c [Herbaspirillum rubrisubalbicans]MCP1571657.1 mono/diheme cytochrome c family protein [Herbaspirillum rubrisubalbicans]
MRKPWNSLLAACCLLGAVLLGGSPHQAQAADDAQLIQRGQYLAIAGDCAACHSEKGRAPFSGGHPISSPLGTIYSTNITPSKSAGIGSYTREQFAAALRQGVRADGSALYPAMPYTAYARLTDDDVTALYAYFMQGMQAVDQAPPRTALPFPFNIRLTMKAWNWLFLDRKPFEPDPTQSAQFNRGAYLVQGLAHCSTCHTPRNFLMAEQLDRRLQGASLGNWYAPDISPAALQAKPAWTREMLVDYLATGHAGNGATAGGPMLEAIEKSFSRMSREDLQAMATYLLPAPALSSPAPATATLARAPTATGLIPVQGDDTPQALAALSPGARIYLNNCASCHNTAGQGQNGLPSLQQHPLLRQPNADNVAMAILEGVLPEHGQGMIGFAHTLNDEEIAAVTNYLMQDIGGSQVAISGERVKVLRAGGETSPLLWLARAGLAVLVLVLLGAVFWWRRRARQPG